MYSLGHETLCTSSWAQIPWLPVYSSINGADGGITGWNNIRCLQGLSRSIHSVA
jgi:hypothetical protein